MAQKKKILVVDDERDIVKALMIRLKTHGYDVVTAFEAPRE
jgi:DNA-binding response OmpR family regulator